MMHPYVGTEHLLIGLLRVDGCVAGSLLTAKGLQLYDVREDVVSLIKEKSATAPAEEGAPFLAEYSRDLTQAAGRKALDPLIGREKEVERIIQILSRRTKNNPILLGEPGVGKTAIVEGLATRDRRRRASRMLPGRQGILALDLSLDRGGHEVPGPVRGAAQGDHPRAASRTRTSSSSSTRFTR